MSAQEFFDLLPLLSRFCVSGCSEEALSRGQERGFFGSATGDPTYRAHAFPHVRTPSGKFSQPIGRWHKVEEQEFGEMVYLHR